MDREREFVRFLSEFLALHTEGSTAYLESLIGSFMKGARGSRDFPPPRDELRRAIAADMGTNAVPTFVQNYLTKSLDKNQWPPHAAFVAGRYLRRNRGNRLMSWPHRQKFLSQFEPDTFPGSELGYRQVAYSQGAGTAFTWRGTPCFKTNYDIALYTMLLDELRPATIVELGAGSGGSGLFFADMCAAVGVTAQVISVDLTPTTVTDPRITFTQADCIAWLEDAAKRRNDFKRPLLVVEDFHGDLSRCFGPLETLLDPGDYLIVEDSLDKQEQIAKAIGGHKFLIDTKYTDFYGMNCTSAMNSIFVKDGA